MCEGMKIEFSMYMKMNCKSNEFKTKQIQKC